MRYNNSSLYANSNLQIINTYHKAAKQVFTILNKLKVEWWPTEGTLIGMLRWGDNFGTIHDGILATDTDIDVMIRVKDEEEWNQLKQQIETELLKDSLWTNCEELDAGGITRLPKFTCYTSHTFGRKCYHNDNIHLDLHSYMVDEEQNLIFMDPICKISDKCKDKYPFQNWNGKAPYRGLIVDNKGDLAQAKFNDMVVPCPFKALELLGKWHGNEYVDGELHLPVNNCILKDKWRENAYNLTAGDKIKLCHISKQLASNGMSSFSYKKQSHIYPKKLTIVTCYIKLNKSKQGTTGDINYRQWMLSLLSYNGPMIIFSDIITKDYITLIRNGLPH